MLLLYTHKATNRVKYTFHLIFGSVLGVETEITTDRERFTNHTGAKISYAEKPIGDEVFFESSHLLFETGASPSSPLLIPIAIGKERGAEAQDVFALSFFLASRYEEYLPYPEDNYGRFSAKQSFAYRNDMLHKPMVNIWAEEIRKKITVRYPQFFFPEKKYSYTPTIDIDNAYAYLGKGFTRTLGGYFRDVLKSESAEVAMRKKVLAGKQKDPYDTYEFMASLHGKYGLHPVYFFLLADWAENDKNLPHNSPLMLALIRSISSQAETGIHPSFASNEDPTKITVEKKRLKEVSGKPVTRSRQHFLKLKFPDTYRNLIDAGITDDYTMGYADEIGFRAGICSPYKWYDLEKEAETNLTIHPFAVMDGTLNNYQKLSPAEAIEKVKPIVKEIKNVNGEFITIWHNETLSNWRDWEGWKNVYEEVIKIAI